MEQTLRERLAGLSPIEKAEAIQVLIADLGAGWPGIGEPLAQARRSARSGVI